VPQLLVSQTATPWTVATRVEKGVVDLQVMVAVGVTVGMAAVTEGPSGWPGALAMGDPRLKR
jgi:hypothetical protein